MGQESREDEGGTHNAVPVQLTDGTLLQVLLGSSNVVTLRQVGRYLLTNPTAIVDAHLRIRKAPFEVRHVAAIGRLLAQVTGVLAVYGIISASDNRGSLAIGADGLADVELRLVAFLRGHRDGKDSGGKPEGCIKGGETHG
jgi:hypothetical protein